MPLVQRIVTIEQGAMVLTGNTLNCRQSTPYPPDPLDHVNGSYISLDTSLVATAGFTGGTTFTAPQSSSSAVLSMPAGSTVLYAQLSWMLFNASPSPDSAISFRLPTGVTLNISPDLAVKQTNGNVSWQAQDVTTIVNAAGSGTYIVANVSGNPIVNNVTISSNAWWLMVLYRNQSLPYRYFNINTGFANVSPGSPSDFNFAGFYTPSAGAVKGYLLVGESNGDLIDAAQVFIGPNLAGAVQVGNPSVGVWNNAAPYAQINNMLPGNILIGDTNDPNIGLLDTRGSFGTYNRNPFAGTAVPFARNNCDILGLDISNQLTNNQNTLFTRVTDVIGGGILVNQSVQVDLQSANLGNITKSVDKPYTVVGDTLTYTVRIENTGLACANNVVFMDTLPSNTSFVSGSVIINGVTSVTANPALPGINLSQMAVGQVNTVSFRATVNNSPSLTTINNNAQVTYDYLLAAGFPPQYADATSNFATSTIVSAQLSSSKTVNKTIALPGDILAYTIPITNSGNTTASNVIFIDTISSNITIVPNSFRQDGVIIPGFPNPLGVTLNNISGNSTSTVAFQATVSTTPSSETIPNNATMRYFYGADLVLGPTISGSTITNTVMTTITNANVSINKSVDRLWSDLKTTLNYTLSMSNTGVSDAGNVVVMDTIPLGTLFVSGSVRINGVTSVTANPALPGINLGTISSGTSTTITFSVFTDSTLPYPQSFVNNAQTTYRFGSNFASSQSNLVTTTLSTAIINTSKSVNRLSAVVGDVLAYTIPITNIGTTIARSVVFIDTVPSGTTFVPNSLRQDGAIVAGNPNPPGVVLNNIPPNTTSTVSFQTTVTTLPSSGSITNFANVSYTYTVDPGTTPIIVVTTATETNTTSTSSNAADLTSIVKSVNRNYTDVNTTLTYTVAFSNTGNATANNVIFMDTIPLGTNFVTSSVYINGINNPGANPALPGINLVSIGPNIRTTITFNVLVSPTIPYPTSLPNTAQVTYNYTSGVGTIFTQGTSNTVLTTLSTAIINTSKSVNRSSAVVGDVLTYTIPITNIGTTIARNVVFLDTVPSGTTFVPNSLRQDGAILPGTPNPPGATLNNIPAGATSTVTFQTTVTTLPSSGLIANSANINYTYTVDPSTTPIIVVTTATNTNTVTSSVNSADLSSIVKSVSRNYVDVNTTITYTVAFSNTGNTTANNVVFMDTIPSGSTFITGSVNINGVSSITANPALPGMNLGTIGANIRTTITFNVLAAPTIPYPSSLTNNAQVTYNYAAGGGSIFTSGTSNSVVTTISGAVISTSKRVNKTYATLGDVFNYTLPLTNSGTTVARNVVFVDTLANGLTFVTNSIRQDGAVIPGNPASPGVTLNNIPPNTTSTVSFQAIVTSIPISGVINNTGSFSYTYTVDPATTPVVQITTTTNTNSTTTTISAAVLSNMTKGTDVYFAKCGDVVTFTITLPNTGNATAINVIFTDTIPPGTTFVPNSVTVNGTVQPGATPIPPTGINIGNIAPGSSTVVKFKVNVTC